MVNMLHILRLWLEFGCNQIIRCLTSDTSWLNVGGRGCEARVNSNTLDSYIPHAEP